MIKIRLLKTINEYLQAEKLQKKVWQFADREIVPLTELVVAQKIGGAVIGAFDKSRLVGFCFSVPAYSENKLYHHSRMLGVLNNYQNTNIGYRLKLAQRKFVQKHGIDLIRWTFDPLQSRNAYFNIEKLGVVVRTYLVNVYGAVSSSKFNVGLETDRFYPEWFINSQRVLRRLENERTPPEIINRCTPLVNVYVNKDDLPEPAESRLKIRERLLSVPVPLDIDKLKTINLKLAQKWRVVLRNIFTCYFKKGYVITGFIFDKQAQSHCGSYVLSIPLKGSELLS